MKWVCRRGRRGQDDILKRNLLHPRDDGDASADVQLLGISKRGDIYLRTLLIHRARTVVRYAPGKMLTVLKHLLNNGQTVLVITAYAVNDP